MASKSDSTTLFAAAAVGAVAGMLVMKLMAPSNNKDAATGGGRQFSTADQPARFAAQKAANDRRALDIDAFFDGARLKGKRVLVTGSNRGIGLALVKELAAQGAHVVATCRKPSAALGAVGGNVQVVEGIDVTPVKILQNTVSD